MTKNTRVPLMVSVLLAFGAWFSCLLMILCFSLSALRQSWIAGEYIFVLRRCWPMHVKKQKE